MLLLTLLLGIVPAFSGLAIPFRVAESKMSLNQFFKHGGEEIDQVGVYWVGNLTLGNPPQQFSVVFDTETADLVIPDVRCTEGPNGDCYGKRRYNANQSSTYKPVCAACNLHVWNKLGMVYGPVGADDYVLGDRPTDLITIPGFRFLQATSVPEAIRNLPVDGVLGMGLGPLSELTDDSPFTYGVKNGNIGEPIFSIWLEHYNQTDDLGTAGVIYYGGSDMVHCGSDVQWFPMSSGVHYQVTLASFSAVSGTKNQTTTKVYQAIFDTTTPYIEAPSAVINLIMSALNLAQIPGQPLFIECSAKISLTLGFANNVKATLTERDLITSNGSNNCILNVKVNPTAVHLGVPFFRGRCTYFDVTSHSMGYASALKQGN